MTIVLSFLALVAVVVAFAEGHRRGQRTHPDLAPHLVRTQRLVAQVAAFNAEAETRETAAYERGRLDQAEIERDHRRASALKGHATKRERRVNTRTGETRPVPDAGEGPEAL